MTDPRIEKAIAEIDVRRYVSGCGKTMLIEVGAVVEIIRKHFAEPPAAEPQRTGEISVGGPGVEEVFGHDIEEVLAGDAAEPAQSEALDMAEALILCGDGCPPRSKAAAMLRAQASEIERLRIRLLSAAGDDLCRLSQEEIKAYTSGAVKIPPREEFIPSCERFHSQIAKEAGVMEDCLTLAQLIAENKRLRNAQ